MKAVMLVLAAVFLLAVPMCMAENVDIENAVVGKELSGRKLMRNLLGDYDHEDGDWGKDYKKDKYKKKTTYITSTYEKDPKIVTSTYVKYNKKFKTTSYVKSYPVTTYEYKTYEKVYKKKYPVTYYKTSTITYDPYYSTFPKYYYKKDHHKGWGDDYHIPKEKKP